MSIEVELEVLKALLKEKQNTIEMLERIVAEEQKLVSQIQAPIIRVGEAVPTIGDNYYHIHGWKTTTTNGFHDPLYYTSPSNSTDDTTQSNIPITCNVDQTKSSKFWKESK